jgi:hypothetical protein
MTTDEHHINYEVLAQDAFRGIVGAVLVRVAKTGALPGEHHFYISFDTRAGGVVLSKRLMEKYPEEMTIVLQHRFRDLIVSDSEFEVKLTFDGIPERLVVPFTAVKVFFDPSVPYGLQFDGSRTVADTMDELGAEAAGAHDAGPRAPRVRRSQMQADAREESTGPKKARNARKPKPAKASGAEAPVASAPSGKSVMPATSQPDIAANDTKIIQLDKFRKK